MKAIYNIKTKQHATMPCNIWGNRSLNETLDTEAFEDGWRYVITVPHGERYKESQWIDDGTYYQEITIDYSESEWSTIVSERQAAEAASLRAISLPRWILENAFLLVCQQYFGDTTKRNTKELLIKAFQLMEVDQKAAMMAFAVVIGLDKELTRLAGECWWDSCEWHDDPEAITQAQIYLGLPS